MARITASGTATGGGTCDGGAGAGADAPAPLEAAMQPCVLAGRPRAAPRDAGERCAERREADMQARPYCCAADEKSARLERSAALRRAVEVSDTRTCVIRSPLLAHGVVALLPPAPAARAADEAAGAKRTQVHALGLAVHQQLAHRQPRHRRPQNALEE